MYLHAMSAGSAARSTDGAGYCHDTCWRPVQQVEPVADCRVVVAPGSCWSSERYSSRDAKDALT
jgi:hypothetical protein